MFFEVVKNQQNQNDVELVMFILKSIDELNITDNSKKINFVDSMKVSDEIKDLAKNEINQGIVYSDHKKVSYGMYQLNAGKCSANSNASGANVSGVPDYINFYGTCFYQPWYTC